jgi:hypothetical protein
VLGWRAYCVLRPLAPGLDYIAIGLVVFSLAVLTSMAKGGVLTRWGDGGKSKAPARPDLAEGALANSPT